jgi:hypothetical protein
LSARCGVFAFTAAAQFALHLIGRLHRIASAEPIDQSSELHKVRNAEERALLAHDHLRIRGNEVGPLRRNGADGLPIDPQQNASSVAGIALAYANEILSTQGVKRMRDAYKARRWNRNICILD